jgi:hypothetical protein
MVSPWQMAGTALKVVLVEGLMMSVLVAVPAHSPLVGVKVYVAGLVVVLKAGDHVPATPFNEVVGKGLVAEEQMVSGMEKVGLPVGSATTHWGCVYVQPKLSVNE